MAALALIHAPTVDGVRQLIRLSARTSLAMFGFAFIASAAWRRFPGSFTLWLRQNRRQIGLGFALSHAVHAAAIIAFAKLAPSTFYAANSYRNIIPGGLAYIFIIAMSATSFDRSAAWVGPKVWRPLHTVGVYYIWAVFFIAYVKRIPAMGTYIVPAGAVLILLIFRIWPIGENGPKGNGSGYVGS